MQDEIKKFIDENRNTQEFYLVLRYKQGHCPGSFYRNLFNTIKDADSDNLEKLEQVFPLIVACLKLYRKISIYELENYMKGR